MSSIPESVPNFLTLQDGVDKVIAAHPNDRAGEITALATFLGMGGNAQSKNAALLNLFRSMFGPLPQMTWIDAKTIEIEAKTVVMFDGSNYVIKRNTAAIQIDLSNDLDTGSEATSTIYYVWLCGDGSSTTYTAVFSTSDSAPTGYTYYKLIGAVYNNSSGDIERFYQIGNKILFDYVYGNTEIRVLTSGTSSSFADVDCSGVLPSFAESVDLNYQETDNTEAHFRRNGSSATTGIRLSTAAAGTALRFVTDIPLDSNQIFEYKVGSGTIANIWIKGYLMDLS